MGNDIGAGGGAGVGVGGGDALFGILRDESWCPPRMASVPGERGGFVLDAVQGEIIPLW